MGLLIYMKRPKFVFIYVLAIYPIVTPIILNLLIKGNVENDTLWELYFNIMRPTGYLLLLLLFLESSRTSTTLLVPSLLMPVILLMLFFFSQSVLVAFNLSILYQKAIDLVFVILPLFLLWKSDRLKPDIWILMRFFYLVFVVEIIFSLFNLLGVTVYDDLYEYESFEKNAISGTFARYNHLANYLTTIYLVFCFEYTKYRTIKTSQFYMCSFIVFILTLLSGSKVSFVLLLFSLGICMYVFLRNKVVIRIAVISALLLFVYTLMGVDALSQKEQETSLGYDRIVGGLANAMQSSAKDDESSSTLFFSFLAFEKYFDHPIRGNGYSFNGMYSKDYIGESDIETIFMADTRLAYTIIEYGLIGCLLYFFMYYRINRILLYNSSIKDSRVNVIFWTYFLLLTVTEVGIFDTYLVLIMFIYLLSKRSVLISKTCVIENEQKRLNIE